MIAFPLFPVSTTGPAHLIHPDLLIRIKFGESMKLLIALLLLPSSEVQVLSLTPRYQPASVWALTSTHGSDKVLHSEKTTGNC